MTKNEGQNLGPPSRDHGFLRVARRLPAQSMDNVSPIHSGFFPNRIMGFHELSELN